MSTSASFLSVSYLRQKYCNITLKLQIIMIMIRVVVRVPSPGKARPESNTLSILHQLLFKAFRRENIINTIKIKYNKRLGYQLHAKEEQQKN